MTRTILLASIAALTLEPPNTGQSRLSPATGLSAAPVLYWSHEARRAIVPPGPGGLFGQENYGNKFPGEAAVYMGLVHSAMHDVGLALTEAGAGTDAKSAIATGVHHTLAGLQPALGLSATQQAILDAQYESYMAGIAEGTAKSSGIALGARVASAFLATRRNDGREANPVLSDPQPPRPGPGVWEPGSAPALGLRLVHVRPLALENPAQFRPNGPPSLTSPDYAADFQEVDRIGSAGSATRTTDQTSVALFWTDHDLRQWNDGLLRLAVARQLDLLQASRMLAMAHVTGGDAMIACFDAKYAYWFWRPHQAIPRAATDGNSATAPDPSWKALGSTPNFPEFPSAHTCHSAAIVEALSSFFGHDQLAFSLDSRVTGTTRTYERFRDIVDEVESARVLVGFHFRHSDREGTKLGRQVARYILARRFKGGNGVDVPVRKGTSPRGVRRRARRSEHR